MKSINGNTNSDKRGFQHLNVFWNAYQDCAKPVNSYNKMTEEYKKFVCDKGPYDFFITVTFGSNMRLNQCCVYVNTLIHRHNSKLFGRNYYNKSDHVEGFAFVEEHKSNISKNDIHIHMLVKRNERYNKFSLNDHKNIFYDAASKIVDDRNNKVFRRKCIDIRDAGDGGRVGYCFKHINDKNLTRVKIIGKDGLPDNL